MNKEEFLQQYEPDGRYISRAENGDMVMDTHGNFGIVSDLSDSDARVYVGGYMEVSQTGDNGHDTLEINGYKIYKLKKQSNAQ